jgi:hypothetical protein
MFENDFEAMQRRRDNAGDLNLIHFDNQDNIALQVLICTGDMIVSVSGRCGAMTDVRN